MVKEILAKIKRGMGSTFLGFVIIITCYAVTIMSLQLYEIYASDIRLQILSDVTADGASVYGYIPKGMKEDELAFMADSLLNQNRLLGVSNSMVPHADIVMSGLTAEKINERDGFTDTLITLNMSGSMESYFNQEDNMFNSSLLRWRDSKSIEVVALSMIPDSISIPTEDRKVLEGTISQFSEGSDIRKALEKSLTYYGWAYSREHRWEDGARDCSSFILSCYDEMELFTKNDDAYTETMWRDGISNGKLKEVTSYPFDIQKLRPGDIIFFSTDWGVEAGRERGIGSCAIYLGKHEDTPKIYLADEITGNVSITNLYGYTREAGTTNNKIVGYITFGGGSEWFDIMGDSELKGPLEPGTYSYGAGFGPRVPPTVGASSYHLGLDIFAAPGTKILAAGDGTVTHAGPWGTGGYAVILDHGNGVSTVYCHGDRTSIVVSVGDEVRAGQVISHVGDTYKYGSLEYLGWYDGGRDTGASDCPHLHFAVMVNGRAIDPCPAIGLPAGSKWSSMTIKVNPD